MYRPRPNHDAISAVKSLLRSAEGLPVLWSMQVSKMQTLEVLL